MNSVGFDFELSFLSSFVQQKLTDGQRDYDPKRSMLIGDYNGMDMVAVSTGGLNFGPYSAPSTGGYSKNNAPDRQESNPLFQPVGG